MPSLDRDWARPGPTRVQARRDVYMAAAVAILSVASTEVWHSAYVASTAGSCDVEAYVLVRALRTGCSRVDDACR